MLSGDHHAWLRTFRRRLFAYACALSPDTASAEDLYQDTLVRAMSAASTPEAPAAYRVWLFRILRNLWIDKLRADARSTAAADSVSGEIGLTLGDDVVINRLAVREAFMRLSKEHRDILALVDIGGFTYEETARILETPRGTVMSRVSRARNALASKLTDESEDGRIVAFPSSRRRGR